MRHQVTHTIAAPVAVVWRTFAELERWPEWTPTVTALEPSNKEGLRVGDTAAMTQPGQRDRVWTVTAVEEGTSFVWEAADPGGIRMRATHVATAESETTTRLDLTFEVTGPMAWLAALMGGRTIRRFVDTEAASIKTWCEKHA